MQWQRFIHRLPNRRRHLHAFDPRLRIEHSVMSTPPVPHAAMPTHDARAVIISGPSGVGKGTLSQRLLAHHPHTFATTVSHTTRAPRPGERPGVDYHFVSAATFAALVARDAFVEHACFGGHHYGTSRDTIAAVRRALRVPILDIEMEGVKQIKLSGLPARFVFIAPPSMHVLEQRLRGRATESEESIQKRLAQAEHEMAFAATDGAHDVIIVNDDLDRAYVQLENFILGPR
ncbi:hypothetical protein K3495_g5460 [Podosphaera aphanis]|nr:hypothetical protein K3495_g5460 [Podosphaera aphanis]